MKNNNGLPTLKEGERIDDLNRNGYRIIQNSGAFCFGMDAVLLSDFAKAGEGERVIDLGTGTGIIPILMSAKTKAAQLIGIDIQAESVDMARRSVQMNGIGDRVSIEEGDIKSASAQFGASVFNVVTSNPPYMTEHHGLVNSGEPKAIARHELLCSLDDVVREASRLLKMNGRFYMVHRPFRLPEIISTMKAHKLEPKRMRLVHPFIDKEPNMVLIEGLKGGKPRMTIEPPLIVYKAQGEYTDEIYDIYGMQRKA